MIYENPCRACFFKGRFSKKSCSRCHRKQLYFKQKDETRVLNQHDCDTCKHFSKLNYEEPCKYCDNTFSMWERVYEDEGDDE